MLSYGANNYVMHWMKTIARACIIDYWEEV